MTQNAITYIIDLLAIAPLKDLSRYDLLRASYIIDLESDSLGCNYLIIIGEETSDSPTSIIDLTSNSAPFYYRQVLIVFGIMVFEDDKVRHMATNANIVSKVATLNVWLDAQALD